MNFIHELRGCLQRANLIFICLLSILSFLPTGFVKAASPFAAIIIDDFGGVMGGANQFLSANYPITVAIMPFLPETKSQAEKAYQAGLEVIIHLPLEPLKGKISWLGPKPITEDLSIEEVRKRVEEAILDVPHAIGINNHMGSKIVENEEIMRCILEVTKEHNLFFIDSKTNPRSVIPKLADELAIPYAVRDVFLDSSSSNRQYVYRQMSQLSKTAKYKGQAIAIGHVGVRGIETFEGIHQSIVDGSLGLEIVPVSFIVKHPIDKPWLLP